MTVLSEAELQLLVAMQWFRSEYAAIMGMAADAPCDREHLERFADHWMGRHRVNWYGAFDRLLACGLIQETEREYVFTDIGRDTAQKVNLDRPLCYFEYENYYRDAPHSQAHARFCEQVYGKNLCQHGLADDAQLQILLDTLQLSPGTNVLDLGCGNGHLSAYLAELTGASFTGVDLSDEAIRQARSRAADNAQRVTFYRANMSDLPFAPHFFDVAISIDAMYFVADISVVLKQLQRVTRPGGQLAFFFTQWIRSDTDRNRLAPDQTNLARALHAQHMPFTARDLTQHERAHWRTKVEALEALKPHFEQEGTMSLFWYRYIEARHYDAWNPARYARFLYHVYT
jgi:ubiquinone/menaquinone biosynthesis C-methylase UbiE